MQKHYATFNFQGAQVQTHYRKAGEGPALLMLHPSPLSSAFMVPLMELLQDQVCAIAPDTPGYGSSDPMPEPGEDLAPYVDWLCHFQDALGVQSSGVYGSATGAQIAIQFARTHPKRVDYVVLENAVHFSDEERDWILKDYFPDMTPKADGSHFMLAWEMAASLFKRFPWFDQRDEAVVSDVDVHTGIIHATAMAYLAAGSDYARAYKAAFENEDARNLQQITRPTRVIRWDGSILRNYAARLDDFDWPENIRMVRCEAPAEARFQAIKDSVQELLA